MSLMLRGGSRPVKNWHLYINQWMVTEHECAFCKLEFAYRAQRFQVSAQAARFKKGKTHGVKWRPCLGGGLVCVKFFSPCSKFTGQNVFWTVQSSCGVYRASCAPLCIEIKVRSVWHAFQNVTCSCVRFVCVSSVAESVLRVALAAT